MKEKIFNALKQAYSHLGLGDEFLTAHADALAASSLVTDENLANVVAAQKSALEFAQKANDKRAAEAQKKILDEKAKAEAELKKKLEDAQRQIDELKKKTTDTPPDPNKDKDEYRKELDAFYEKMRKEREEELAKLQKQIADMGNSNVELTNQLKKMQEQKATEDAERAKAERQSFILSKAKEIGLPEWRIKQGFSFADDMDEAKITETLTGYANDIKTNLLPKKGGSAAVDTTKEVSKEEAADIAKSMIR